MMTSGWRERLWSGLDGPWDLIVIGGGITGAGILREATSAGWKTLLVEAKDFASGTSSRSSKLVHGGLRYLARFQLKLTLESVREREHLLHDGPGLIEPLESLIASYAGDPSPAWMLAAGLLVYDALALRWQHERLDTERLVQLCPALKSARLTGGFRYFDAQTDDARLVLRLIVEAVRAGGAALNYARVEGLLRDSRSRVRGVQLRDEVTGAEKEVRARRVINATGAWADALRGHTGAAPRLRPLRGSHLFFPRGKLPLQQFVGVIHPVDRRPVFFYPWEGVTLVGTTDVDHKGDVAADPRMSEEEIAYLMHAVDHAFHPLGLTRGDVLSATSGVRPVLDTGASDPSKEPRDFALWKEHGLLTVTGGKLTTFRPMALAALRLLGARVPKHPALDPSNERLDTRLPAAAKARLIGRYGSAAPRLVETAQPGEMEAIADSPHLWAELRFAARAEGVVHLDDLLLRRVRLGITTPGGALPLLERIRAVVQPELGWSDDRWSSEGARYAALWRTAYSVS